MFVKSLECTLFQGKVDHCSYLTIGQFEFTFSDNTTAKKVKEHAVQQLSHRQNTQREEHQLTEDYKAKTEKQHLHP